MQAGQEGWRGLPRLGWNITKKTPSSDPDHSGLHPDIILILVRKVKHLFSLHYLTPHPLELEKELLLPFPPPGMDSLLLPPVTSGALV